MMRLFFVMLFSLFLQISFATDLPAASASKVLHPTLRTAKFQPSQTPEWQTNKVYHASYFPTADSTEHAALKRKSKWSKWLGIGSVIGLFLPILGVLSIPAAIISLIFAGQIKNRTDDKTLLADAKTGKVFSIITLGIIVLSIIVVLLLIAILLNGFR